MVVSGLSFAEIGVRVAIVFVGAFRFQHTKPSEVDTWIPDKHDLPADLMRHVEALRTKKKEDSNRT